MGIGTEYASEYQKAERAYMQGKYEEAATIIDRLLEQHPDDPSVRLLCGHIYCYGLQQYVYAFLMVQPAEQAQYKSTLGRLVLLCLRERQQVGDYGDFGCRPANARSAAWRFRLRG